MIEIVYCTHSMDALFWGPYNIQQNGFSVLPDVRTSVYVYSEKKTGFVTGRIILKIEACSVTAPQQHCIPKHYAS